MGPVSRAIVRQDTLNGDSAGCEPSDGPDQHRNCGEGGLVIVDLGAGNPGVVIDHGVDERVFHQFVAVLVARLSRSRLAIPVALLTADEPPAAAVRNVVQLLDVEVDERAGVGMLVTTHCGSPVARSMWDSRFNPALVRMRPTVVGAIPVQSLMLLLLSSGGSEGVL